VLDFPSLGVWGALLVWGGIGPSGLLVRALGKYLDPVGNRDRYGPQNPANGGTKISEDCPRGLSAQGSRVTWQLAVQFKMCWRKASWTKYNTVVWS